MRPSPCSRERPDGTPAVSGAATGVREINGISDGAASGVAALRLFDPPITVLDDERRMGRARAA